MSLFGIAVSDETDAEVVFQHHRSGAGYLFFRGLGMMAAEVDITIYMERRHRNVVVGEHAMEVPEPELWSAS